MVCAYILINLKPGLPGEVVGKIREVDGVKMAHVVTGLHDIVAFMEAPDLKRIGDQIVKDLRGITEIGRTVSCVGSED